MSANVSKNSTPTKKLLISEAIKFMEHIAIFNYIFTIYDRLINIWCMKKLGFPDKTYKEIYSD